MNDNDYNKLNLGLTIGIILSSIIFLFILKLSEQQKLYDNFMESNFQIDKTQFEDTFLRCIQDNEINIEICTQEFNANQFIYNFVTNKGKK